MKIQPGCGNLATARASREQAELVILEPKWHAICQSSCCVIFLHQFSWLGSVAADRATLLTRLDSFDRFDRKRPFSAKQLVIKKCKSSSMEDWTMMRPPDVGRLSTIGPHRMPALPFGMFGPRLCGFGPVGIFAMRRNWGRSAQASFSSRSRAQNHWSCQ